MISRCQVNPNQFDLSPLLPPATPRLLFFPFIFSFSTVELTTTHNSLTKCRVFVASKCLFPPSPMASLFPSILIQIAPLPAFSEMVMSVESVRLDHRTTKRSATRNLTQQPRSTSHQCQVSSSRIPQGQSWRARRFLTPSRVRLHDQLQRHPIARSPVQVYVFQALYKWAPNALLGNRVSSPVAWQGCQVHLGSLPIQRPGWV